MKYLTIIFIIILSSPLISKNKLDIKNTRSSDSMYYQQVINDTLILTNNTKNKISVIGVGLSCGCTVVSESKFDINPNSKKKVPFTVDLTNTINGKSIYISILTSDKDTILSNYNYPVKDFLLIEPKDISIITPNKSVKYEFKIVNTSDVNIAITDVSAYEIDGNKVELNVQKDTIDPGETIIATLAINDVANQNNGELEIGYKVNNSIALKKSINYTINKGN